MVFTRAAAKKQKMVEGMVQKKRLDAFLNAPDTYRGKCILTSEFPIRNVHHTLLLSFSCILVTRLMSKAIALMGVAPVSLAKKIDKRRRTDVSQSRARIQVRRNTTHGKCEN